MGLEAIKVEQTIELMTALEDAGYPTYIVGGAVRDTIMKLPIKDLDIATKATPAQVEEVVKSLEGYHYISGGQAQYSHPPKLWRKIWRGGTSPSMLLLWIRISKLLTS